jgi:SAM-dependent methyltransferase
MYRARPDLFADAAYLPVADSSADTVVILEVLEHLRFPGDALREIARVLRPGGRLLLTMPFLYPVHDAPHDYQRYTVHGLIREMENAGLDVENVQPSLASSETAGLIANLALSGMGLAAIQRRSPAVLLLPLIALAIPAINISSCLLGRLLPSWPAIAAGYILTASKP